jgi:pimeloyl-ACP methyl ester carboxylesterase
MKFNKRVIKGVYDRTSYNTSATPYNPTAPEAKQPKQPNIIKAITDKEGLDKAYAADEKLHVNGNTMYVAGTSNMQDAWDDLKIPFGQTSKAKRYKDADALLAANPQVENLVGHSLGGASVLELQKQHPDKTFKTNVYGTPTLSFTPPNQTTDHRYRNDFDPVSIFDRAAEKSTPKPTSMTSVTESLKSHVDPLQFWRGLLTNHSYSNFDTNMVSDQSYDNMDD